MKLRDFLALMEETAPGALSMVFDNVGLLAGPDHDDIRRVLVALDCTLITAQEAVDEKADILLTHHPRFFDGVKRILPDDPETAGEYLLIRHGIGHFAAHTNLDSAPGGVNDALARSLGIKDAVPFPPDMMGRIGELEKPATLDEFASFVGRTLDAAARVGGDGTRYVRRVAVLGGAGGGDWAAALEAGADAYVTGEMKHHEALAATEAGLAVIVAGHYETECVALDPLMKHLQERSLDVQYKLTRREGHVLRRA